MPHGRGRAYRCKTAAAGGTSAWQVAGDAVSGTDRGLDRSTGSCHFAKARTVDPPRGINHGRLHASHDRSAAHGPDRVHPVALDRTNSTVGSAKGKETMLPGFRRQPMKEIGDGWRILYRRYTDCCGGPLPQNQPPNSAES